MVERTSVRSVRQRASGTVGSIRVTPAEAVSQEKTTAVWYGSAEHVKAMPGEVRLRSELQELSVTPFIGAGVIPRGKNQCLALFCMAEFCLVFQVLVRQ
jgi:hypothetical protein